MSVVVHHFGNHHGDGSETSCEPGNLVDELTSGRFPMFSTLVKAIMHADLVETLKTTGGLVVLCPTDMAFKRAGISLDGMDPMDVKMLLLNHVFKAPHGTQLNNQTVTTLGGKQIIFDCDQDMRCMVKNSSGHSACILLQGFSSSNADFAAIGRVLL